MIRYYGEQLFLFGFCFLYECQISFRYYFFFFAESVLWKIST